MDGSDWKFRNDQKARVGIVDDSHTMRKWLRFVLESDPRFEVVFEAENGLEARDKLRATSVDVISLDVDMPCMGGFEFLSHIMTTDPLPVVMLSAHIEDGGDAAVEALSLGAIDCIEKPKTAIVARTAKQICTRVYMASQSRVQAKKLNPGQRKKVSDGLEKEWTGGLILLGASTGGVTALQTILEQLEAVDWPVIIAQHMPTNFLNSFCRRLNKRLSRKFYMARDGLEVRSGQGIIATGQSHATTLVRDDCERYKIKFAKPSKHTLYHPNIDALFETAASVRPTGFAAVLTGMGTDGAEGLKCLKDAGVYTFAQSEESCTVYGMPKAAVQRGAAIQQLSDEQIGKTIAEKILNSAFEQGYK